MSVLGCGLIGGSVALSWKKAGLVDHVIAFDINEENQKTALEKKVADECTLSLREAVEKSDIIVVSVPVKAMESVFAEIGKYLKKGAVVTDVGSTRGSVIAAARKGLGDKFNQYAPAHPIAGGEMPGVEYADPDLFLNKVVISTPAEGMDPKVVELITENWKKAGSKVQEMTPEEHDRIFASVSHLPHVLAYALVDMIAKEPSAHVKLKMAGAGFRDFTRIAASSPVMWRDICISNRDAISEELRSYRKELDALQKYIDEGDAQAIERVFENAMRNRRGLVFPGK